MNPDIARISLGDVNVGTMFRADGDKTWFTFSDEYRAMKDRPVLSQSFLTADLDLVKAVKARSMKVDPFFSNLLPEGALRDFLSANNGVNKEREFFLLKALGADLSGAVIVSDADGEIVDELDEPELFAHGEVEGEERLRFSLAGVQLKFSAHREVGKGFVIPAKGLGGEWIVKLPDFRYKGVPENEFSMMSLAKEVGLDVPQFDLVDIDKVEGIPPEYAGVTSKVFAIKRFDRDDGKRIHIEDFAQVFGLYPANKYEQANYASIGRVLKARVGSAGLEEFIRRLAFSITIGNGDMHVKNWSLIYPDGVNAQLAPAYDFVSTVVYMPDSSFALSLGGTKNYGDVGVEVWEKFADEINMPRDWVVNLARNTVDRTQQAILAKRSSLPADEKVWETIEDHPKLVILG